MARTTGAVFLILCCVSFNNNDALYCADPCSASDSLYRLAVKNIAGKIKIPPLKSALIVNSEPKSRLAGMVRDEIEKRGMEAHILTLSNNLELGSEPFRELVNQVSGNWALVFLLHPVHAGFLVETVGRPDLGIKLPEEYLFCDWLIPEASLVRTYAIDMDELHWFRDKLLQLLRGAAEICITSESGTEVTLYPREWNVTDGEIFTAPREKFSRGKIFVDGCAYGNPPEIPFCLKIEEGRVVNSDELNAEDKQQRWVKKDLSRDGNSCVLAELGIGINPGARWDENVMESEQARGTVHFGFGDNICFGGENQSSYHIDYVILKPTVKVDGKIICEKGEYKF